MLDVLFYDLFIVGISLVRIWWTLAALDKANSSLWMASPRKILWIQSTRHRVVRKRYITCDSYRCNPEVSRLCMDTNRRHASPISTTIMCCSRMQKFRPRRKSTSRTKCRSLSSSRRAQADMHAAREATTRCSTLKTGIASPRIRPRAPFHPSPCRRRYLIQRKSQYTRQSTARTKCTRRSSNCFPSWYWSRRWQSTCSRVSILWSSWTSFRTWTRRIICIWMSRRLAIPVMSKTSRLRKWIGIIQDSWMYSISTSNRKLN